MKNTHEWGQPHTRLTAFDLKKRRLTAFDFFCTIKQKVRDRG